jgi:hypothetical protein
LEKHSGINIRSKSETELQKPGMKMMQEGADGEDKVGHTGRDWEGG